VRTLAHRRPALPMLTTRSRLRWLRRLRPRHAAPLLAALALALSALGREELPVLAAGGPDPWPHGRISYFDQSGSRVAVAAAATRWNRSGARVRFVPAPDRRSADVVFVADGRALRSRCASTCLGVASAIGRPGDGRATVIFNPAITGAATPLNVWVAMHELGHVLGLRHREGRCSLMNARAYEDSCSFVGTIEQDGALPCGPASSDVAEAARIYGRAAGARPCR
jgi:Dual-action HEIGH metallo-peptidase